ncbi:MAG: hypothetical protein ACO1ON_11380 [Nocardioides sp.]
MSALILLLVLVTTAAVLAAASVLREVVTDDPRHARGYAPPRSHHLDAFEASGSTYR